MKKHKSLCMELPVAVAILHPILM